MQSNKGRTFPVEVLTQDEVKALIKQCSPRASTGIRNRALLAVMYCGALRVTEALRLREKDLDRNEGSLTVLHGKGDKRRVVALSDSAWPYLDAWLDHRRTLGLNGRHTLFSTLKGGELSGDYVRQLLPRLGERAGIEKRCHAHGLRHSMAYALSRDPQVPLTVIQQQLGHSSLTATARYIDHINPRERLQLLRDRDWLA